MTPPNKNKQKSFAEPSDDEGGEEIALIAPKGAFDDDETREGQPPDDENYNPGPTADTGSPRSVMDMNPRMEGIWARLRRALWE